MMIHDITAIAGKHKARKRVGRGLGSGQGKTAGRGYKGAGSRSGNARKTAFEGGQMPYFRRIRKVGFSNARFETPFWIVNLREIVAHPDFARGGNVDAAALVKAGLIRDDSRDLKILGATMEGQGALGVKLNVTANRVSAKARQLVLDGGGTVNEVGTRRDRVRGVDRNSEDRSPKNLDKKLRRGKKGAQAGKPAAPAEAGAGEEKPGKKAKGEAKGGPKGETKAESTGGGA